VETVGTVVVWVAVETEAAVNVDVTETVVGSLRVAVDTVDVETEADVTVDVNELVVVVVDAAEVDVETDVVVELSNWSNVTLWVETERLVAVW
jgi:hypothetical protein